MLRTLRTKSAESLVQKNVLLAGVLWLLVSCHSLDPIRHPDHPEVLDKVVNNAQSLLDSETVRAMLYIDSAFATIAKPGIGDWYKLYDFKRNYYYEVRKNYDSAALYADSSLALFESKRTREKYYQAYIESVLHKGDILLAQRKYYKAYQYYYDGRIAIDNMADTCVYKTAIADFCSRLGTVNYRQAKYRESVNWYQEAVTGLYTCNQGFLAFAAMQGTLDNVALGYTRLGMADSALYFYNKALSFITTYEHRYPYKKQFIEMSRGVIYGNQGDAALQKGDTATASMLYRKSIAINSQKGYYNADALITRLKLAEVYCKKGNLPGAALLLEEVAGQQAIIPNEDNRARWLKLNWQYYHLKGEPQIAGDYLQRYFKLKDSLDVNTRKLTGVDISKEFQSLEKEYKLSVLHEKDKIRSGYLVVALIVSLMAVVVALVLWYGRRQVRENTRRIALQNQRLEVTLTELEQSNKSYAHLLKIVAHDLRNPIGAIGNIASFLLSRNRFSPRESTMLELIQASSRQSLETIADLMEVNFSTDHLTLVKKEFEVQQLLHQCIDLLRFKAKEKGQQIILKAETFVLVQADYDKIWRVINNLVMNAIKFSPSEGKIFVSQELRDSCVQIAVKDAGGGIPDALKEKVFDLFTEAKRPGTLGEQPFGMGLYISRQIMQAHEGTIWFECEEGSGSTFYITIPIKNEYAVHN